MQDGAGKTGKIVIISSPSGGGKTSICRRLLDSDVGRAEGWQFSVSYTTRPKRPDETDGKEYHFVDRQAYDKLVSDGFFAEYFTVHGNCYGTPREPLEQALHNGSTILLDVDYKGALRLKRQYPEAITIFILPPPPVTDSLKERLSKRGTESAQDLGIRFRNALDEMKQFDKFEYIVINRDLDEAVRQVLDIIEQHPSPEHPCRTDNMNVEQLRTIIG
ncbi:MAG: guanylate kinase [Candidatus Zixiibacteriota bacterium]